MRQRVEAVSRVGACFRDAFGREPETVWYRDLELAFHEVIRTAAGSWRDGDIPMEVVGFCTTAAYEHEDPTVRALAIVGVRSPLVLADIAKQDFALFCPRSNRVCPNRDIPSVYYALTRRHPVDRPVPEGIGGTTAVVGMMAALLLTEENASEVDDVIRNGRVLEARMACLEVCGNTELLARCALADVSFLSGSFRNEAIKRLARIDRGRLPDIADALEGRHGRGDRHALPLATRARTAYEAGLSGA